VHALLLLALLLVMPSCAHTKTCRFGLESVGVPVPEGLKLDTSKYLSAYAKKHAQAKEAGKVDLTASDAISFRAYLLMQKKLISKGDTFAASWTCTQWNLICRRSAPAPYARLCVREVVTSAPDVSLLYINL